MLERSNTNKMDLIKLSADTVSQTAGNVTPKKDADNTKNPAAVALGRLGGLKGGKARAKSLSKERRTEIAKKAARKRWGYED